MKPHDASLVDEQEKCLTVVDTREEVLLSTEDASMAVISAELAFGDASPAKRHEAGSGSSWCRLGAEGCPR
jgi:predicted RNase H-like HicB family nuclease